jgi:pimeloyl-ACP methyl ester carboxylesterase
MHLSKLCHALILVTFLLSVICTTAQAQQKTPVPAKTYDDVSYGDHPNQVIDFWRADTNEPAPLVVFIHGGGFSGGSHERVSGAKIQQYLDAGIHHASVEYRLTGHAPLPAAHADAVRALQFIRSKAEDWGIDKDRIAAYGASAGAQLVAYLAWHDDFANSQSNDLIARESSRLIAVAPLSGQSTLDFDWWVENIPGYRREYHENRVRTDISIIERQAILHELSIINHISPDDPPTFMSYRMNPDDDIPDDPRTARGWSIHHVNFGIAMQDKLQQADVEVLLSYPQADLPFNNEVEFLIHHLKQ